MRDSNATEESGGQIAAINIIPLVDVALALRGDKSVLYGKITPILDEIGQTGLDMTMAVKS